MPLVGGFAGMFFAALLGYVTTKKAGTPFAMITLGIGELVAPMVADGSRVLRRRGRRRRQSHRRQAVPRHHLRAADPGLLPASPSTPSSARRRCSPSRERRSAACSTPCATTPSGSSSSATARSACATSRSSSPASSPASPAACTRCNFEIATAEVVGAGALRRLPAVHVPRRRDLLLRADHRRRPDGRRLRAVLRGDQGLAALPRPDLHVHGDVRAGRHRQPDHDEPARRRAQASCIGSGAGTRCSPAHRAGHARRLRRADRDDLSRQFGSVGETTAALPRHDARHGQRRAVARRAVAVALVGFAAIRGRAPALRARLGQGPGRDRGDDDVQGARR